MKRSATIGAAAIAAIGLLVLASYMTTSIIWDGGFPSGEFRVNVQNPEGKPVKGAVLHVFRGGTRNVASGYPLDNHLTTEGLDSDDGGRITAIRKYDGSQFGGHAWQLFWVIPMGARAPEYDCEITADGFKPLKFPLSRIFESPHRLAVRRPEDGAGQTSHCLTGPACSLARLTCFLRGPMLSRMGAR